MKSPIIALPLLLQIAIIAALYFAATSAPVTVSPFEPSAEIRATEIHTLRQQRDRIDTRLSELDGRIRPFNPRGFGGESDDTRTSGSSTDTTFKQESK